MTKYELTIDESYCSDWSLANAVRELFQNSLDEELQNPDNKSYFSYDSETKTLTIGNKNSSLSVETLLLGVSSKKLDSRTVGQFGEGYKIATVVLLRNGKTVTFYNYSNNEVWQPRMVKSRRYGGRNVPTFFVDKAYKWKQAPDMNLTITISEIDEVEYEDIKKSILCLNSYNSIRTPLGEVLMDSDYCGCVYVGGLFVCKKSNMKFGYNLLANNIKLDRDRKLVDTFSVSWETSKVWSYLIDTQEFKDMLFDTKVYDDIRYVKNFYNHNYDALKSVILGAIGDSVPVSYANDCVRVMKSGRTVYNCNEVFEELANAIVPEVFDSVDDSVSIYDLFCEWSDKYGYQLSIDARNKFNGIMERLKI